MPAVTPYWVVAKTDIRAWSAAHEVHKQGWIREGCRLRVVEAYKTFYRVDALDGTHDVVTSVLYPEVWVYQVDVSIAPAPPVPAPPVPPPPTPVPSTPSDEAAFEAFVALVKYLKAL